MNTPFFTIRTVLIISFFVTQQTCGMELVSYGKQWLINRFSVERVQKQIECSSELLKFEHFSQLLSEIRLLIFKYSDNKANFQEIDTYWYQTGSIKSPEFINEFNGIGNQRMCRIFLNAVYTKNYDGVENILKHYYAQRPDRGYYYFVDMDRKGKDIVLDPYDIADADLKMMTLLREYKIAEAERSAVPSPLLMACLAGSSDFIEFFMQDSKNNIKRALNIVISCDYAKCMQQLLSNGNKSATFEELFLRDENRVLLQRQFLMKACTYKSYKVLKILLDSSFYNKNEIVNDTTMLDQVLELEKYDSTFASVVEILKECGAKTAQEITVENDNNEEDMLGRIGLPF